MKSCTRLLATTVAMIATLAAEPAAFAPATAEAASRAQVGSNTASQRVKLGLNKSVVIDLPSDAYDILVANPTVADAVTRTARRIYLFGKAVGQTNIFVFGPNGEQIVSLDLAVERDVAGLEDYIKRFIPNSQIKVELINDNVVLTGTVDTPLDSKRAVDLATIFVTGGEATTGQYSQTASGGSQNGGVDINNPDQTRQKSKIVNLLQIIGEDQVTLKVTVAEVSRTVMKQLGVNLIGAYQVTAALNHLLTRPGGRVINISSIAAYTGGSGAGAAQGYAAAKAGLIGLTYGMARELAPQGVTVNAVAPGFVADTGFTEDFPPERVQWLVGQTLTGRAGETADVAAAVSYLASPDASWVCGQVLHVNGGTLFGR